MATRQPAVAGQFYPAQPQELRTTVARYIQDAGVEPGPERVAAIVAPHAGYIYSGPTAGFAFARIRGKKPQRVILAGGSHRHPITTAAVYPDGAFETPLGPFPIDKDFAVIAAREFESQSGEPHLLEHSLEVQLPFLYEALGIVPIVPILFGGRPSAWHIEAGQRLAGFLDESDLVIASTDLSHYQREERANQIDKLTIDTVLSQDLAAVQAGLLDESCSMCGGTAVLMTMACSLARGATDWALLDYRTSGAVYGDYDRVVGYASLSMERPA